VHSAQLQQCHRPSPSPLRAHSLGFERDNQHVLVWFSLSLSLSGVLKGKAAYNRTITSKRSIHPSIHPSIHSSILSIAIRFHRLALSTNLDDFFFFLAVWNFRPIPPWNVLSVVGLDAGLSGNWFYQGPVPELYSLLFLHVRSFIHSCNYKLFPTVGSLALQVEWAGKKWNRRMITCSTSEKAFK